MLSYTTECPVTIYRIEIICRRYKSTLKIMLSISTQALPRWPAHRQAHGTMWLGPIPQRKKANFPTLGPRFLVKFPRVGKAKEVNLWPVGSVGRAPGFCVGGRGINPPHRPTLRVFKINWGEKCCLCNDICKWLDFLVFSDKDDKSLVPSHNPCLWLLCGMLKKSHTIRKSRGRSSWCGLAFYLSQSFFNLGLFCGWVGGWDLIWTNADIRSHSIEL